MATGVDQGMGWDMNITVKLADPENHTKKPKITTLFYT